MTDLASEVFTRLFTESRDALWRYIRRFVRSKAAAEEIVQEAFLRTYEQGDAVRTPRAFLFSTARNLAADRRRRERVAATQSVPDFEDFEIAGADAALDDALIADEASRLLKQSIERLPPQCRAALTLKVLHGYSYKEIGGILGLSEKTVEKHIARGLDRTHTYLRARYSNQRGDTDE